MPSRRENQCPTYNNVISQCSCLLQASYVIEKLRKITVDEAHFVHEWDGDTVNLSNYC